MENEISKAQLTTLTFIHFMLIFGVLLFMSVVYFLLLDGGEIDVELYNSFIYIVPIVGLIGYYIGEVIFKKIISGSKEKSWNQRLQSYQTAMIAQDALLEGPALLGVIASLLTNSPTFMVVSIVLLGIMFLKRPTEEKIRRVLGNNTLSQ